MKASKLRTLTAAARLYATGFVEQRFNYFAHMGGGRNRKQPPSILVVAPHSDDELLGTGALVVGGFVDTVFYPLDMEPHRRAEAQALADACGYVARFNDSEEPPSANIRLVLLPSPRDTHPAHQAALTAALYLRFSGKVEFGEYAVAGRAPYCVPTDNTYSICWGSEKREIFKRAFPSQREAGLDDRFFALEGYSTLLGGASITVTCSAVGFHNWPSAPPSHAYLRYPHRHVFGCRVTIHDLYEADRQIEYHDLQTEVKARFEAVVASKEEPDHSCEAMARRLAIQLRQTTRKRVTVRVDEDGENWSEVSV